MLLLQESRKRKVFAAQDGACIKQERREEDLRLAAADI